MSSMEGMSPDTQIIGDDSQLSVADQRALRRWRPSPLDHEVTHDYHRVVEEGGQGMVGVTTFFEPDSGWDRDEFNAELRLAAEDKEK